MIGNPLKMDASTISLARPNMVHFYVKVDVPQSFLKQFWIAKEVPSASLTIEIPNLAVTKSIPSISTLVTNLVPRLEQNSCGDGAGHMPSAKVFSSSANPTNMLNHLILASTLVLEPSMPNISLDNQTNQLVRFQQVRSVKKSAESMYEAFGRVLESGVAEHLGNSHVKFLLTRFKNVAYQAEHVADSFVAGEGSIWVHKLGLFVVIKNVKILHKELKAMLTMTMATTCVTP
ncbi:hypothetical protein ACH5RR_021530 [Cinchona calisaya]|uniref:Uncharacterized protein n=1 Tax=Cinchona calisaya TaxID=153742 RepID=A0ABD2ZHK1_9GENT